MISALLLALWVSGTNPVPAGAEIAEPESPMRAGTEPLDPAREARVQRLGKLLRCPVCQGVSIADSPAGMARAMLDKTRELVAEGKSDQEIFDYFEARYGEWVQLEPKREGAGLLAWVAPVLILVLGLAVVVYVIGRRPAAPSPTQATPAPTEDPLLKQVRAELEE